MAPPDLDAGRPVRAGGRPAQAGRDAGGFLDFLKKEGKPGLLSFVGNAYKARLDNNVLTLLFDESHANLIPMIKTAGHLDQLTDLVGAYFNHAPKIVFDVGRDPKLIARSAAEEEALRKVSEHPTVKYILEEFNGKILNCQIMGDPKE